MCVHSPQLIPKRISTQCYCLLRLRIEEGGLGSSGVSGMCGLDISKPRSYSTCVSVCVPGERTCVRAFVCTFFPFRPNMSAEHNTVLCTAPIYVCMYICMHPYIYTIKGLKKQKTHTRTHILFGAYTKSSCIRFGIYSQIKTYYNTYSIKCWRRHIRLLISRQAAWHTCALCAHIPQRRPYIILICMHIIWLFFILLCLCVYWKDFSYCICGKSHCARAEMILCFAV